MGLLKLLRGFIMKALKKLLGIYSLAVTALLFFMPYGAYAGQEAGLSFATGTTFDYVNQRGSKLSLTFDNGNLTGTFTTAVGCGARIPRRVIGTYNGWAVSFTVNFQECQSITAWTGQFVSSHSQISTLWYLSLGSPPQWNSTIAGADIFK
jgi:hypothetical protein